jgi:hypothetical protein
MTLAPVYESIRNRYDADSYWEAGFWLAWAWKRHGFAEPTWEDLLPLAEAMEAEWGLGEYDAELVAEDAANKFHIVKLEDAITTAWKQALAEPAAVPYTRRTRLLVALARNLSTLYNPFTLPQHRLAPLFGISQQAVGKLIHVAVEAKLIKVHCSDYSYKKRLAKTYTV